MTRAKPTVKYKKKDGIAIIAMNRPEYNNAQNGKMTYDLDKAFKKAVDDDEVKVIVLKGNGRHFSAGHDIGTPGRDIDVEYEVPGVLELGGEWWKLKGDIKNNTQQLIVDLKTTSNLDKFSYSAKEYNYDSQAYIYSSYFGMDMVFVAIDKTSGNIGIFDCSAQFLERGKDKVEQAIEQYRLFYKNEDFDPAQYLVTKTL